MQSFTESHCSGLLASLPGTQHLLSAVKAWSSLRAQHLLWAVLVQLSPGPLPSGPDLSHTLGLHVPAKVLAFLHWNALHSCWLCYSDLAPCFCFLLGKSFLTPAMCICRVCLYSTSPESTVGNFTGWLPKGGSELSTQAGSLWGITVNKAGCLVFPNHISHILGHRHFPGFPKMPFQRSDIGVFWYLQQSIFFWVRHPLADELRTIGLCSKRGTCFSSSLFTSD